MKDILISIIIPVYNAEKYIGRCVESIINQTYPHMEIILVDDGSSDNSLAVCRGYAENDDRIKVLHKENGGASSARNAGIKASTGKYIGFVDSDDYIDASMYEKLLNTAVKNDAAIAMCGYYRVREDKKQFFNPCGDTETISSEQMIKDVYTCRCMGVLWNKLFKRSLFFHDNETTLFDESIHFCEDVLLLTILAKYSKNIACCSEALYNYIIVPESLCHGNINKRKLTMVRAMDLIEKHGSEIFPSLAKTVHEFAVCNKIEILLNLESTKNAPKKWAADIKRQLRGHLKNSDLKLKLKIFTACYFPFIYKWMKTIKKKLRNQ